MKKKITRLIGLTLCLVMLMSIAPIAHLFAQAQVSITVHNPKAHIERIPITPLAERLETFHGKTIGVFNIGLAYNNLIAGLIHERFGGEVNAAGAPIGTNPFNVTVGATTAKDGGVAHTAFFSTYETVARVADAIIITSAF